MKNLVVENPWVAPLPGGAPADAERSHHAFRARTPQIKRQPPARACAALAARGRGARRPAGARVPPIPGAASFPPARRLGAPTYEDTEETDLLSDLRRTPTHSPLLAARSGLWTPEEYRGDLAGVAVSLGPGRPGRTWRPLLDTAIGEPMGSGRGGWLNWDAAPTTATKAISSGSRSRRISTRPDAEAEVDR